MVKLKMTKPKNQILILMQMRKYSRIETQQYQFLCKKSYMMKLKKNFSSINCQQRDVAGFLSENNF